MGKIVQKEKVDSAVERPSESDLQLAIRVSDRIELENVRLMSCHCKHERFVGHGKMSYDIERSTKSVLEAKEKRIFVLADFKLEIFEAASKTKGSCVRIEATFLLAYQVGHPEELTPGCVEQFGKFNGIYNAWPYWREFVQNTIARMSLPPLTIPVFRLVAPPKEAPQKASKRKAAKKTGKKAAK
jgi:hypothetical protein